MYFFLSFFILTLLQQMPLFASVTSPSASRGEFNTPPLAYKKDYMEHAVLIEITPQGKKNIQNNLQQILGTLGVNPAEGRYGEILNTFADPLQLSDKLAPETFKIYQQIQKFFSDFFLYTIQDPRPQIRIGPSAHTARFKKISLVIPENPSNNPDSKNELFLNLDLELEDLTWTTSSILITDLNNIGFNISFLPHEMSQNERLNRLCQELDPNTNDNRCGILEFKDVKLRLEKNDAPLRVSIPLKVSQLPNGHLKFNIISIKHNIQNLKVHRNYSGFNFFLDQLQIGNQTLHFQKNKLDEVFKKYEETLVVYFKHALIQFLESDLANQLDRQYENFIANHSETISERTPPGRHEFGCVQPAIEQVSQCQKALELFPNQNPKFIAKQYRFCLAADPQDVRMTLQLMKNGYNNYCPGFICPSYIEGLKVSKLNFQSSIVIDLSAFIADPLFQAESVENRMQFNPLNAASKYQNPDLNALPKENYEMAMAINRGFFNRIIQLSWNRGYLKEIKGTESLIKLVEPPVVVTENMSEYLGSNPLEAPFRIQLKIDYKIKTTKKSKRQWTPEEEKEYQTFKDYIKEKSFKSDSFILKFDVLTKLTSRNNALYITPFKIDTNTVYFDKSQLTWLGKQLRFRILSEVQTELEKQTQNFSQKPLPFPIPLPPEIWGIRFDTQKIEIDPHGFLVLYLKYTKKSSTPNIREGAFQCLN